MSLCSGEEIEKTVAINVMIYAVKIETKLVKLKCEAGHFIIPKNYSRNVRDTSCLN